MAAGRCQGVRKGKDHGRVWHGIWEVRVRVRQGKVR